VSKVPQRRIDRIEARFFTEAGQVDEGTFWQRVEEIARQGYRARITPEEVRWTLTLKGREAARLIREQGAGR
jgi:hypothetical protein